VADELPDAVPDAVLLEPDPDEELAPPLLKTPPTGALTLGAELLPADLAFIAKSEAV